MEKSYKITITSYGPNPNYEAELADFNEKGKNYRERNEEMYMGRKSEKEFEGSRMKTERVLEVYLNEAEYKKLKLETLKIFE